MKETPVGRKQVAVLSWDLYVNSETPKKKKTRTEADCILSEFFMAQGQRKLWKAR